MNKLIMNYRAYSKEITLEDTITPAHLLRLLQNIFQTQQEILGITDPFGKFYDLSYAAQHIKTLNNHKFNIVTAKDAIDNVSFGSHRSNKRQSFSSHPKQKCLGLINDLQFFRKNMSDGIVVILSLQEEKIELDIVFEYFLIREQKRWFEIWNNRVLLLRCQFFEACSLMLKGIEKYLMDIMQQEIEPPLKAFIIEDTKRTMILDAFEQLLNDGIINQVDYYKKKSVLLEKPHYFIQKYFTGETIDRNLLFEQIREDIVKKKNEAKLLSMLSSNSPSKQEIPILVRKGTNVIEKVSTEHPLSIEQEQILNELLQYELTGLITENENENYKTHVLGNNKNIMNLFQQYHNKQFDQIKLAKSLRRMFRERKQQKKLIQ